MKVQKQDLVYCGICRKQTPKTFLKLRGKFSVYVDDTGAEWSGRRCPACYKDYKAAYDAKRRKKLGHAPIGASVPCSAGCGSTVTLGNGTHRMCTECRVKKSTDE